MMKIQNRKNKQNLIIIGWLFILPAFLIRAFTTIYPIIMTFVNSLFDIRLLSGIRKFAGLRNYVTVFADQKVRTSISFTIMFVLVSMVFHIFLGIILALVMNIKFRGKRFLRTIVLIPWAMPAIVIGMAAKWAFNNDYGLINDFIRWFVPDFQLHWLINTLSARWSVIVMDLWKDLPFFSILILSGLQFISHELYEAATVDGASPIQSFFYITLPLIFRNVITLCIPFTMWRLITFDLVYAMTAGGPGEDTALIAYRITTEVYTNLNIGYGSTLAIYLFAVMVLFSMGNIRLLKKVDF
jgi:multiple sugar transport system permease protein